MPSRCIIIVSALSALLMLEPSFGTAAARPAGFQPSETPRPAGTSAARSCSPSRWSCAGLLARSVHELPGMLVAYGRYAATRVGQANIIYVGEGLNASVAVSRALERRAQLSQRRQGPGVERAAGHAPAADARPPDDADSGERRRRCSSSAAAPASPPARCRSIRRSSTRRSPRSSRSCRRSSPPISPSTTSTSSATRRCTCGSTTRGISSRRRARSSTRSRPTRSIRG